MHVKITFDDGMDIIHLSEEPVHYLGNMVNDLVGSVFYEKSGIIYQHSADGSVKAMGGEQFDYVEGEEKFIYTNCSIF